MRARLEIQNGPEKGRKIWVSEGMRLGRKNVDVMVSDPKISGYHAKIIKKNDGLAILDRNSTHGLWGPAERVESLLLEEGVIFKLGDSEFRVLELELSFRQIALQKIAEGLKLAGETSYAISELSYGPFPALIHLEFLQGAHEGEVWPLGYGPRIFGKDSMDGFIFDPEAKAECFRLLADNGAMILKSDHEHFVQINGRYVQEENLSSGDHISFGQTLIKVWW